MGLICLEIFLNFMLLIVLARAYSVVDGSFIIVSDDLWLACVWILYISVMESDIALSFEGKMRGR